MIKKKLSAVVAAVILMSSFQVDAAPMKEFIMSCTYGVLAGTLVGAASLAFTEQPGDNLQKVARGASLGLYAGILLGFYVIYVVPGQLEDENRLLEDGLPQEGLLRFQLNPYISDNNKIDGAVANYNILRF